MYRPAGDWASCLLMALALAAACGQTRGADVGDAVDPRVTEALKLWNDGQPGSRHEALRRFRRLGPRAASAFGVLITGLADPDPKVRAASAEAIERIGPAAGAAVPALLAALGDPVGDVRRAAAWALGDLKPDPVEVLPALLASIRAAPDRRCPQAVSVLGELGEQAVPVLVDLLRDDDPDIRRQASWALRDIGAAAKPSIAALIDGLRTTGREGRATIAGVLAGVGSDAVGPLVAALRDADAKVRGGAARALERLGPRAQAAAPALVDTLFEAAPPDDPSDRSADESSEWRRRGEPVPTGYHAALRAIGVAAVEPLLERLELPDRASRLEALRALELVGYDAKPAVARLLALFDDPGFRFEAASALGGLGPAAREAIPRLITGLHDPDAGFRARAAETLGRIGWEAPMLRYRPETLARGAVAPLAESLEDPDARVRAAAARALEDLGTAAAPAVPALLGRLGDPSAEVRHQVLRALRWTRRVPGERIAECLSDPDARVRLAAAEGLRDEDLGSGTVVTKLLAALGDTSAEVRAAAAHRLARINARAGIVIETNSLEWAEVSGKLLVAAPGAAATLRKALDDPEPRVRAAATYTLPLFPRDGAALVPLLTARLKDSDARVRLAAAVALPQFGVQARAAVPALFDALSDPAESFPNDFSVVAKAAQAIRSIEPEAEARMVDRLLEMAGSPLQEVRQRAGEALESLGPSATGRLVGCLIDPKAPRAARVEMLRVLAEEHGLSAVSWDDAPARPNPELIRALAVVRDMTHDEDVHLRNNARKLLANIDPAPEARARLLLETARVEDPVRGYWIGHDLDGALEPSAGAVLLEGLKDQDDEVRTVAAHALAALGEKLPRADDQGAVDPFDDVDPCQRERGLRLREQFADALVPLLKDPDTQVRWAAAWALYVLGTGRQSVPALIAMAGDRTTRVRPGATIRLTWEPGLGNSNRCVATAEGEPVRVSAIQALGGFGAAAAPAVPILIETLRDDDLLTRWFAAAVLGKVGPQARTAVDELVKLLHAGKEPPRVPTRIGFGGMPAPPDRLAVVAARALGEIGAEASGAVPALMEALADPDPTLRAEAARALGAIGPAAHEAVAALVWRFRDTESNVAHNAASALGLIGAPAVPALIDALGQGSGDVRRLACEALRYMGPAAEPTIPALLRTLANPEEETRILAAEALAEVARGPAAEPAVAGLKAALDDSDDLVRDAARKAITAIREARP